MTNGEHIEPGRRGNGADRSVEQLQADIERHRHNLDATLNALEGKLSPGELLDEGLRYVKTGPGEFLSNLASAAKRNPLPTALTALGLGWLFVSSSREEGMGTVSQTTSPIQDDELVREYARHLAQDYGFDTDEICCIIYDQFGPEVYERYTDVSEAKPSWWQKLGGAASEAHGKSSELSEQTRAAAADLREQTRTRLQQVRNRMAEGGEDMRQRINRARSAASQYTHRAQAMAQHAQEVTVNRSHAAMERASEFVDRNPMLLIAMGLMVGTALASSLPVSRREKQMLGDTGESLRSRGKEALQEKAEQARETASAAWNSAVAEAEAQGLGPDEVAENVHRTREKVERVGAAARDAAHKEGKKE